MLQLSPYAEFQMRALPNYILFVKMIETAFVMLRKMGDAANWAPSVAKGVLSLLQLLPPLILFIYIIYIYIIDLVKDVKMNLTVSL